MAPGLDIECDYVLAKALTVVWLEHQTEKTKEKVTVSGKGKAMKWMMVKQKECRLLKKDRWTAQWSESLTDLMKVS
jgi:hypothetical protein